MHTQINEKDFEAYEVAIQSALETMGKELRKKYSVEGVVSKSAMQLAYNDVFYAANSIMYGTFRTKTEEEALNSRRYN